MEEKICLHISTIDSKLEESSVFFVHPQRLPILHVFSDNVFESCLINYTAIDYLSSLNLAYIMRTLKPHSTVRVVIYQPISVMQDYDIKQVEANAKLAGFSDFETSQDTFKDIKTGKEFGTIGINFTKPVRNSNKVEIEVTTTTTTITKSGVKSPDTKAVASNVTVKTGKNEPVKQVQVETNTSVKKKK